MEDTHESLMDRTGMGPLIGLALALFIALIAMMALLLDSYLAMGIAVIAVIGALVVVTVVIAALAGEDEDDGASRKRIPGLS